MSTAAKAVEPLDPALEAKLREELEETQARVEAIPRKPNPTLAAALVEAQRAAGIVGKHGKNKHFGYSYATTEDMIAEARGALGDAGVSVTPLGATLRMWTLPNFVDADGVVQDADQIIMLDSRYLIQHGASGESREIPWECPVLPEKGRPIDKAIAAARTYSLGYLLRDLLLLPRVEAGTDVDQREDRQGDTSRQTRPQAGQQRPGPAAARPAEQRPPSGPPDWGDKALNINKHVADARTLTALDVAAAELAAAVKAGLPAQLAAPISSIIDQKRAKGEAAKAAREAQDAQARNGGVA